MTTQTSGKSGARRGAWRRLGIYSPVQQGIHWLTVLLMFAILPVAWVMISVKEESPQFLFCVDLHYALGLSIFILTVLRVGWRFFDPPPPYPSHLASWNRWVSRTVYFALLLMMIVMPISGYLWSNGHGHRVYPFQVFELPRIAFNNRPIGDAASIFHRYGQWIVYLLIATHLGGVSYHLVLKRDGLLARILPPQRL